MVSYTVGEGRWVGEREGGIGVVRKILDFAK